MSTFFVLMWFVSSIVFVVSIVLRVLKKEKTNLMKYSFLSAVVFFIAGVIALANEPTSLDTASSKGSETDSDINIEERVDAPSIDVNQFKSISTEKLIEVMGEPTEKQEWEETYNNKNRLVNNYVYEEESLEFTILSDQVMRVTYIEDSDKIRTDNEIFEMLGIEDKKGFVRVAQTPLASRYQQVDGDIQEVWALAAGDNVRYAVTYDISHFGGYHQSLLPELELLEYDTLVERYSRYVVGSIKNNTDKTYSYAQVSISLFDSEGNQVGSTLDNVNNLAPGVTWKFKAIVTEDSATRIQITDISGF